MTKKKLESLVPSQKLCKRIPSGSFEDSALVWRNTMFFASMPPQQVWEVVPRNSNYSDITDIPAPLLEEILIEKCDYTSVLVQSKDNEENLATRALKLWFKIDRT